MDTLAGMTLAVAGAGSVPTDMADADMAELPDLGTVFTEATAGRHELA
jgi:hypothetical protein